MSNNMINLIEYNTHNDITINIKDAVKITLNTPNLMKESFWVEVIELYDNNLILCSIQNDLQQSQPVNYLDNITINKNHIKEHKLYQDRFIISNEQKLTAVYNIRLFKSRFGRNPTADEYMAIFNHTIIQNSTNN